MHPRAGSFAPPVREAVDEAAVRRVLEPSLLFVDLLGGSGTAWGCFAPGVACTAKHVVGEAKEVDVVSVDGRRARARVLNVHPVDDIALLDVRALSPPPPPLSVSPVDGPSGTTVVCRAGPRPSPNAQPFLRCDPTAGTLLEYTRKKDGNTLARLLHLGVGIKGDSGGPLFDPRTGLVVGMHVAEENGVGRGATAMAMADTFEPVSTRERWVRACPMPTNLGTVAGLALALGCAASTDAARATHFAELGKRFLALGRRIEAYSAFTETLTTTSRDAKAWLLRALVFPEHDAGRDDAALAFRLEPKLRDDTELRSLTRSLPAWSLRWAKRLRDRTARKGYRLATLIAPRGCASCPDFCAAVRARPDLQLLEAEGANHPTAETWLRSRIDGKTPTEGTKDESDGGIYTAIDDRAARGCALRP